MEFCGFKEQIEGELLEVPFKNSTKRCWSLCWKQIATKDYTKLQKRQNIRDIRIAQAWRQIIFSITSQITRVYFSQ